MFTKSDPWEQNSAFIAPNGDFYRVKYEEHWEFAMAQCKRMGLAVYTVQGLADPVEINVILPNGSRIDPVDYLEMIGWMHVSDGHIESPEMTITQAQLNTLLDWYFVVGDLRAKAVFKDALGVKE